MNNVAPIDLPKLIGIWTDASKKAGVDPESTSIDVTKIEQIVEKVVFKLDDKQEIHVEKKWSWRLWGPLAWVLKKLAFFVSKMSEKSHYTTLRDNIAKEVEKVAQTVTENLTKDQIKKIDNLVEILNRISNKIDKTQFPLITKLSEQIQANEEERSKKDKEDAEKLSKQKVQERALRVKQEQDEKLAQEKLKKDEEIRLKKVQEDRQKKVTEPEAQESASGVQATTIQQKVLPSPSAVVLEETTQGKKQTLSALPSSTDHVDKSVKKIVPVPSQKPSAKRSAIKSNVALLAARLNLTQAQIGGTTLITAKRQGLIQTTSTGSGVVASKTEGATKGDQNVVVSSSATLSKPLEATQAVKTGAERTKPFKKPRAVGPKLPKTVPKFQPAQTPIPVATALVSGVEQPPPAAAPEKILVVVKKPAEAVTKPSVDSQKKIADFLQVLQAKTVTLDKIIMPESPKISAEMLKKGEELSKLLQDLQTNLNSTIPRISEIYTLSQAILKEQEKLSTEEKSHVAQQLQVLTVAINKKKDEMAIIQNTISQDINKATLLQKGFLEADKALTATIKNVDDANQLGGKTLNEIDELVKNAQNYLVEIRETKESDKANSLLIQIRDVQRNFIKISYKDYAPAESKLLDCLSQAITNLNLADKEITKMMQSKIKDRLADRWAVAAQEVTDIGGNEFGTASDTIASAVSEAEQIVRKKFSGK